MNTSPPIASPKASNSSFSTNLQHRELSHSSDSFNHLEFQHISHEHPNYTLITQEKRPIFSTRSTSTFNSLLSKLLPKHVFWHPTPKTIKALFPVDYYFPKHIPIQSLFAKCIQKAAKLVKKLHDWLYEKSLIWLDNTLTTQQKMDCAIETLMAMLIPPTKNKATSLSSIQSLNTSIKNHKKQQHPYKLWSLVSQWYRFCTKMMTLQNVYVKRVPDCRVRRFFHFLEITNIIQITSTQSHLFRLFGFCLTHNATHRPSSNGCGLGLSDHPLYQAALEYKDFDFNLFGYHHYDCWIGYNQFDWDHIFTESTILGYEHDNIYSVIPQIKIVINIFKVIQYNCRTAQLCYFLFVELLDNLNSSLLSQERLSYLNFSLKARKSSSLPISSASPLISIGQSVIPVDYSMLKSNEKDSKNNQNNQNNGTAIELIEMYEYDDLIEDNKDYNHLYGGKDSLEYDILIEIGYDPGKRQRNLTQRDGNDHRNQTNHSKSKKTEKNNQIPLNKNHNNHINTSFNRHLTDWPQCLLTPVKYSPTVINKPARDAALRRKSTHNIQ